MRYIEQDDRVVWSASDLKAAAECEFAWLRAIDAKLGRIAPVDDPEDATLERAARLGTAHELRVLDDYRVRFGDAVREIPAARSSDATALSEAVRLTDAALADPAAEVVYQAAFSTAEFVGFADFLVRASEADAEGTRPWIVQDTKLARRARVTALMQLAAYVDQLDRLGVPRSDEVQLLLGDGTTSTHRVDDLLPVFALRRARLRALIADRDVAQGAAREAIAWGDGRGSLDVVACGRCATCELEVVAHRDLLLVAGMRPVQRERLRAAGIETIDALAAATQAPPAMSADTFVSLRTQARLQLESPAGVPGAEVPATPCRRSRSSRRSRSACCPDPTTATCSSTSRATRSTPREPASTGASITSSAGSTAARPMAPCGRTRSPRSASPSSASSTWSRSDVSSIRECTSTTTPPTSRRICSPWRPLWSPRGRRRPTAARRGLRRPVPVVRRALRVGSRSYSIKKLEPLYMGDEVRTSDVQRGDDSIVKYVEARALSADGDDAGAQRVLDDLADYNRYDCVSTRRLRDWLVDRARESGAVPPARPSPTNRPTSPRRARRLSNGGPPMPSSPMRRRCAWPRPRSTTTRAKRRPTGPPISCAFASRCRCGRRRAT